MDSLFHFVFAFIAGLAIGLHRKHKIEIIASLALFAVLIDIDHFIFAYPRTFHNLFVTALLPFSIFLVAFIYREKHETFKIQSYSLILLVMLVGHLIADTFYGEVRLFYPLSNFAVSAPPVFTQPFLGNVIGAQGIAILIYGGIISLGYFVEDFIYFFEEKHEAGRKAIEDSSEDLF